jgi:hypothetical protein
VKIDNLHKKAHSLVKAAREFWEERQRIGALGAVCWIEVESGEMVLFTRSEYKEKILDNVFELECGDEIPLSKDAFLDEQETK